MIEVPKSIATRHGGWAVRLEGIPPNGVDPISAALEQELDAVSAFEMEVDGQRAASQPVLWRIEGFSAEEPDRAALAMSLSLAAAASSLVLPEPVIQWLDARDWVAENQASFKPIQAGRFYVHGSHICDIPADSVAIKIDANAAFGTGEHETTRGCLTALDGMIGKRSITRVLDMGCGTGILGIAAAKTLRVPVVAADIDQRSVEIAVENAELNGVARFVTGCVSNGYRHKSVDDGAPYDLIFSNILAAPLIAMAGDLARHLAPGGVAVLAGLLDRQEEEVWAAHRDAGLRRVDRIQIGNWPSLVLTK